MALVEMKRSSQILGKQCAINILIPDKIESDRKLPVIWLLHGLGDDGSCWLRKTVLETLVQDTYVAVIMPDMGRSFYLDDPDGLKYRTYFLTELIPELRSIFPLSSAQADNHLVGNSMGGFGALSLAFEKPELFSKVAAISPVTNLEIVEEIMPDYKRILASAANKKDFLFELAAKSGQYILPELFIRIGSTDFLKADCDNFVDKIQKNLRRNIDYKVTSGDHDWSYWNAILPEVLQWLNVNGGNK